MGQVGQQACRQSTHRAEEAVVARRCAQVAEKSAGHRLILRQHRADDDALAIGQVQHVDQVGRIVMDLVEHGRAPPGAQAAR